MNKKHNDKAALQKSGFDLDLSQKGKIISTLYSTLYVETLLPGRLLPSLPEYENNAAKCRSLRMSILLSFFGHTVERTENEHKNM